MRDVHVVSHTHWDREWYHPAERFRVRLVALVDELLDALPEGLASFLLDGQAVILEDYLAVRPERAAELGDALRRGRIEAGPWYVLADELIPSGEGLVRNLLAGRRVLRALRAESPPVLYCPDSFGHPAALPALAAGFQKPLIVLWRGFGGARWPRVNLLRWTAPGGDGAAVYHLTQSGYELGSSLPPAPAAMDARWARIRDEFAGRGGMPVELLLNGADHHARQRDLEPALAALSRSAAPVQVVRSSLGAFAAAALQHADALPEIAGELRDSYGYTWTLQGTLGVRAPQKRRYASVERDLLRDVEPWLMLAHRAGAPRSGHLVHAAWQPLLLCQPHDTLCGCSIDQVARAMDGRLDAAEAQVAELRDAAVHHLLAHDVERARVQPDAWRPVVLVRNRAPRMRSGVALVELTIKVADVPVGPGSAGGASLAPAESAVRDVEVSHDRVESPRAYPDNDAVVRFHLPVWVNDVPAYGVQPLSVEQALQQQPPQPVSVKPRCISNGLLTLRWDARGRVSLEDHRHRRTLRELFTWESLADAGDLYTPSLRDTRLRPRFLGARIVNTGPGSGAMEQRWRLSAGRGKEGVTLTLRCVLDAHAPFLRFGILGENSARDHRLRLLVRTDVARATTVADAAFGPVERPPLRVPRRDARMEKPLGTAPLHRYVSQFGRQGVTLYADGLTEYESLRGAIAVTLLRCVGELSRNDLPERPGHAGWPAPTPAAQCPGAFQAEFGLLMHGPRNADTIDEIERTADDILLPLVGFTLRSALRVPSPFMGVALEGAGLAFSAARESDDGQWVVLRCVNLLDVPVNGRWQLGVGSVPREAHWSRLDETPLHALSIADGAIPFVAAPRAIVTILAR